MVAATKQSRLREYAEQANENHRAVMEADASALQHARAAGEALLQAKRIGGHGKWLTWLEENFDASPKTATEYMRLAREWDKLEPLLQSDDSPSSIRGALQLLKRPVELSAESVVMRYAGSVDAAEAAFYRDLLTQFDVHEISCAERRLRKGIVDAVMDRCPYHYNSWLALFLVGGMFRQGRGDSSVWWDVWKAAGKQAWASIQGATRSADRAMDDRDAEQGRGIESRTGRS